MNTALPAITGSTVVGQTLTASNGSWTGNPTGYSRQWQRCDSTGASCTDIGGATASTYMLAAADAGSTLRVIVTATNAAGSSTATSTQTPVVTGPPVNTVLPAITGSTVVGQTLTASNGSWTGNPTGYSRQWQRCDSTGANCTDIGAATGSTYTLAAADAGSTLRVIVTATNAAGSSTATSTQTPVVAGPPVNTVLPAITGSTVVGQTLTASNGSWTGNPTGYSRQWQRCDSTGASCTDIGAATASTYAAGRRRRRLHPPRDRHRHERGRLQPRRPRPRPRSSPARPSTPCCRRSPAARSSGRR